MANLCTKVSNPCKICLGPVTQKTGLQCQGICESWVHYTCLNYTPGKISDIKSGFIKVTCPCPDCKTTQAKEYRTDEGFSCTNQLCPANLPPKCDNETCPVNLQFPSVPNVNQGNQGYQGNPGYQGNQGQPYPLGQCGTGCKTNSIHQIPQPQYSSSQSSASDGCPTPCPTPPPCRAGDTRVYSVTSLCGVEQMCNTVGELTNQINDLMMKMKRVVAKGPCYPRNHYENCNHKGPKSKCPTPCYCPGNPRKKRQ